MTITFITNIPSPYRNKMFNEMEMIFPHHNLTFQVWYMAQKEPNRKWNFCKSDFKYQYKIFKGLLISIDRYYLHFNLPLLWAALRSNPDVFIVGGAYSSPTHALISLIIPKRKKILWTEGNKESMQKTGSIFFSVKKFFINRYSKFIVPGFRSESLINDFLPNLNSNNFIHLPNIIDEKMYSSLVFDKRRNKNNRNILCDKYNIDPDQLILFSAAQLEKMKALDVFINCLEGYTSATFVIAGSGSEEMRLKKLANSISASVIFLGNKQQLEIVDLLSIADIYVIPSYWDSYPLAPIEAIAAGLPLIASPYIGNFEEVLVPEENGWVFDPKMELAGLKKSLDRVLSISKKNLKLIGKKSLERYNSKFNTQVLINSFAKELLEQ